MDAGLASLARARMAVGASPITLDLCYVTPGDADAARAIADADVVLAEPKVVAPLLPFATRLAWLQSTFAGVEAVFTAGTDQTLINQVREGVGGVGIGAPLPESVACGWCASFGPLTPPPFPRRLHSPPSCLLAWVRA